MINPDRPLLSMPWSWEEAVPFVSERLKQAGLSVLRTFDLKQARGVQASCGCPYHGADSCDCQMVDFLVYGQEAQPATLVAHGHNGQTWFSMVELMDGSNARLEAQIRSCLVSGPPDAVESDEPDVK